MAVGVPVVTTRVGQAMDVVRHGENGWMVEVDDAEGLAHWLARVAQGGAEVAEVVAAGRATAAAFDVRRQLPLWDRFFDGFVERRR
jgi:glycosyltransferase involved in cell wall biosynthesis